MSLIEFKNINFSYTRSQPTLRDVSFKINKGEHVAFIGHNGSGKSTIAKIIMGLLKPFSGSVFISDQLVTEENIDRLREGFGIVFQNPDNQFVGISVKDDIAFGMENYCYDRLIMEKRITEVAKLVSMEKFLDRNPESLSGGEKQRVAIAGILAVNPSVVIFDEATSMLDPKGVREIIDITKKISSEKTFITITHNLEEALLSDRIILLKDGKISLDGSKNDVLKNTEKLIEAGLNPLPEIKLASLLSDCEQEVKELLWDLSLKM